MHRRRPMSPLRHTLSLVALCALGALLVPLAGLGGAATALLGAGLWTLAFAARGWPRSLEALAYGGLGMLLGSWFDLRSIGLASAGVGGEALALDAWCGPAGVLGGAHPLSWTNAGMLFGAAIAARASGCGGARFAVEGVGMLLGMQMAARALPAALEGSAAVLALHAAMCAGMLLGMQLGRVEDLRLWLGRALAARLRPGRLAAGGARGA